MVIKQSAQQKYRAKNPLLPVWEGMKRRCYNPNEPAYKNYGGRGIKVCDKWLHYQGFLNDMGSTYKNGLSLDRIDVNGDYSPENCRWATKLQQANNTRTNRFITHQGRTMTLAEWAREVGIKRSTLAQRFYVYKWPIAECLEGGY